LGFGKANNIGLRKAIIENADYVFLLNQDAWIFEDTINRLLTVAVENKEYGIFSPIHLNKQGNRLEKQFQYFLNESNTNGFVSDSYLGNFKSIYSTNFVSAAAWLLPIHAVKKIGLFDPLYFHYGEDDDYIHRARYHGFKIGIVPSSTIVHDAIFKTWEMLEFNFARRNTIDIVKLKDINYSFRSNFNVYLKSSIDELTTHLLFRQWKKLYFKLRLLGKLVFDLRKVNRSYIDSKREGAFV
jgi:GT2 family glycosyltransferase